MLLFIAPSPTGFLSDILNLTQCLSALHSWFCLNGMALNSDQSDAIIIGTRQRSCSYSALTSVDVAGSTIPLADHVKILGVTLDKNLTFDDHVNAVCKLAHYHIRAMCHIRPAITEDMAKSVACALIGSRLDYANSAMYGMSSSNTPARLQHAQNAAARLVIWSSRQRSTNLFGLLKQLHWLPIESRIKFMIACVSYKTVSTAQTACLHSVLKQYTPSRRLLSSDCSLLAVPLPRVRACFGFCSFAVAASRHGFKEGGVTGVRPLNLQQIIGYEGAVPH